MRDDIDINEYFGHCALSGVVGKLNEWEAYTFKMQNNDINIDSNISKDYYNTITVHDNSSQTFFFIGISGANVAQMVFVDVVWKQIPF